MKELVAREIATRFQNGQRIGIGTGSTVDLALAEVAQRLKGESLTVQVLPTSFESALACERLGLTVLSATYSGELDWGFDGADAVDDAFRLIKGHGGALLSEKFMAWKCRHYVTIVDQSKLVQNIAKRCAIPVEVFPEMVGVVEQKLRSLGATAVVLRPATGKHGPIVTEKGHLLLDATFTNVDDTMEGRLKALPGVVESGLFIGFTHELLIGTEKGVERRIRSQRA